MKMMVCRSEVPGQDRQPGPPLHDCQYSLRTARTGLQCRTAKTRLPGHDFGVITVEEGTARGMTTLVYLQLHISLYTDTVHVLSRVSDHVWPSTRDVSRCPQYCGSKRNKRYDSACLLLNKLQLIYRYCTRMVEYTRLVWRSPEPVVIVAIWRINREVVHSLHAVGGEAVPMLHVLSS